ncbi:MAG: fluoride efflux transporter CrcB [Spirosomaceae bacterium]|jgi:CrcB protein|nr:fluoride efflux transporter CrcB [Spirosomataceae bacterium]
MFKNLILVGFGGAAGSILRYLTGYVAAKVVVSAFPVGTFVANIVGCFIIGAVYGAVARWEWFTPEWRLLLATGFCGGYTTFSALAYENLTLWQSGQYGLFIGYILASLVIGILAVWGGFYLIQKWS